MDSSSCKSEVYFEGMPFLCQLNAHSGGFHRYEGVKDYSPAERARKELGL